MSVGAELVARVTNKQNAIVQIIVEHKRAAMTFAVAADAPALDPPQSRLFTTRDFRLESGVVLPEPHDRL